MPSTLDLLRDAPQDILDGLERDRENSRRASQEIEGKLEELDQRLDAAARPSKEESLDALLAEAKRIGILPAEAS